MEETKYTPYEHAHIKATLCNYDRTEAEPDHGRQISFPISNEDLSLVLSDIGCEPIAIKSTVYLKDYDCGIDGLCDFFECEDQSIEDMNALAKQISNMNEKQFWKFEQIIYAQDTINNAAFAINLAMNMPEYHAITGVTKAYDLGKYFMDLAYGREHFEPYLKYFDFKRYGFDIKRELNGSFSKEAFVYPTGDWTQFYKGRYDSRGTQPKPERPKEPDRSER